MRATISTKKGGVYSTYTKEFNGKGHLENYVSLMERKGVKVLGVKVCDDDGIGAYVQSQEEAYFDNFCLTNNI